MSNKKDIYNELEMRLNPTTLSLSSNDVVNIMNQYNVDEEAILFIYQELTSNITSQIKKITKEIIKSYKNKGGFPASYESFKKEFKDYGFYIYLSDNILKNIFLTEKKTEDQFHLFEFRKIIREILEQEVSDNIPSNNQYVVDDLLAIGKNKPLGYLPLKTITGEKFGGYNGIIEDTISWANSKGYEHILCSQSECHIASGALYIYDPLSLSVMLDKYQDILAKANIPTTPNEYVRHIMKSTVYDHEWPEAYKVIGLTYADKRFI